MSYIACIKGSAVRDAQYATVADPDVLNDAHRSDIERPDIYLRVYENIDESAARAMAAAYAGTDPANIKLIRI